MLSTRVLLLSWLTLKVSSLAPDCTRSSLAVAAVTAFPASRRAVDAVFETVI